uniref:Uncharacterized protein n=1 Tax=Ciona savignyi TaxID=51511 RepID=H2YSQ7_CIOSA
MYAKQQNEFDFSKDYGDYISLRFIFGVHPQDSGDPKDPDNKGKLQFSRFNVSSPHSQRWLLRFCTFLQSHKLYRPPDSDSFNSMCFIATLKKWMTSRSCQLSAPCCEKARFPYKPNIFELCLKEAISKLYVVPGHRLYPYSPGPRFDFNDVIRGVIIEFPTK